MQHNEHREVNPFDRPRENSPIKDLFSPATEYYRADRREEQLLEHPGAKAIVWWDQQTPIYVCEGHHALVKPIEWEGPKDHPNYDRRRRQAYQALFSEPLECDVCLGNLPNMIDLMGK